MFIWILRRKSADIVYIFISLNIQSMKSSQSKIRRQDYSQNPEKYRPSSGSIEIYEESVHMVSDKISQIKNRSEPEDPSLNKASTNQFSVDETLSSKLNQLNIIRQTLIKEIELNYCYPQNLLETKRILAEMARKMQMIFKEKEIGSFEFYTSQNIHEQILYLLQVIQKPILMAYSRIKNNEHTKHLIEEQQSYQSYLLYLTKKYEDHIKEMMDYSKKQKQKVNSLEANIKAIKGNVNEDSEIIMRVQEISNEKLRYLNRNQLVFMIKNLINQFSQLQSLDNSNIQYYSKDQK